MKNIPEIRIKGFEGEWKEKRLEDVAPLQRGFDLPTSQLEKGPYPVVYSNGIGYYHKYYKCKAPGLVTGRSGTIGHFTYIRDGYYWPHNTTLWVTDFKGNEPLFIEYLYKNKHFENFMMGSGVPTLNRNEIHKEHSAIPNLAEQQSLGSFFSSFDRLLSDHHRRLENLRRVKKSMLQKMFPQQGQTVPEIRFKGFSGEWEKAKLSTFLEVSEEKNTDNFYGIEDVLSVSGDYGVVNQIEFQGRSFAGASVAGYGVAETGDVIYTKSPLKSNPYGIIKTNKGKPGIVSVLYGVYHPIKGRTDSSFVQTYFESDARLNNYLRVLINKGSKNTLLISDEDALRGEVCFPSYEEQQRLSSFFTSLDNLINDEVNYIDQLTRVKSTLLQKMFV